MLKKNYNGLLFYLLDNCIFAYDQLYIINNKLNKELNKINRKEFDSNVDMQYIGNMNRMIQDYLIIRIGGLFDKTEYKTKRGIDEVISFEKLFSNNKNFKEIKKQGIIKYIIDKRNNFVAHTNKKFDVPDSSKICDSNLRNLLKSLQKLLIESENI
ncbi:MAG: hypothetical protein WC349_02970 [Patescibacteria group bacterium]